MKYQILSLTCLAVIIIGVSCHPTRPGIPDDPKARLIFQTAEANRTTDGFLTEVEMSDIFTRFDLNLDGNVDETEFVAHWTTLDLGDLNSAITLFHRADTDRNGSISKVPDFSRLFYYFDRDSDGKISEGEFVTVWFSLSS